MSRNSDWHVFVRNLKKTGHSVDMTKGGHLKVTRPDMKEPVIIGSTPSDRRSKANAKAMIKRVKRSEP
jgi:predicted RNA binding protein YcfA (HicA-like mRNA interferase family)